MADTIRLEAKHFTIEGVSRAGHETWFRVRDLGIALDLGRGHDQLIGTNHVFISHAHLDHAAGIAWHAGQRHLQRLPTGRIYVPSESLADFEALMEVHGRLENIEYDIELAGLGEGDEVRVGRSHVVRAHRATHRVAARGYEVLELRHHLKEEFAGRDGAEPGALRQQGVEIAGEVRHPILFYTGDTDRGILERNEALYRADVLLIECSFVHDGEQERAARYRHIHFDDLAEFAERFENELLVLTHFTRRHSRDEIRTAIRRRCPAVLRDRIRLFLPEQWQRL